MLFRAPIRLRLYSSLSLFFFSAFFSPSFSQDQTLPNILWITSEDNSPLLGCYGDTYATTPNLDGLAAKGVLYENAFATAPVCAAARSSLITGIYPLSMGTQHMRSSNQIPDLIPYYPTFLRQQGYYCTNNSKTDYNIANAKKVWDESSPQATYHNRGAGQPFFAIFNLTISHESSIHTSIPDENLRHDPAEAPVPPYLPGTPEIRHDIAQYYDKVEDMDGQVGEILKELEEEGLAENTIVFYFSDHGGIIGRSKRFLYESGLWVPLIIRFPEKYSHLAPEGPGSRTDRIVSFIDFPPTLLSIAGIKAPEIMQGEAFLGPYAGPEREYAFSFRGRMGDVIDMGRSVRDSRFRYTRNYLPQLPYGQFQAYQWRAPSMPSWEATCEAGLCNDSQSAFWRPKPVEELYDTWVDPHNIYNLADDPRFEVDLLRLRKVAVEWSLEIRDAGFLPEGEMKIRGGDSTIYQYAQSENYALPEIIKAAQIATSIKPEDIEKLLKLAGDQEGGVRYWAATGFAILGEKAAPAKNTLEMLAKDPTPDVAIAAAEALYYMGETKNSISVLKRALKHPEPMVRDHALNILRLMGNDAYPALEDIEALLSTLDPATNSYDWQTATYLQQQLSGLK